MTAVADLISPEARRRLLERLDGLRGLGDLIREPGSLAAPDEPVPLHRVRQDDDTETSPA